MPGKANSSSEEPKKDRTEGWPELEIIKDPDGDWLKSLDKAMPPDPFLDEEDC